jgi:hypothetical protein
VVLPAYAVVPKVWTLFSLPRRTPIQRVLHRNNRQHLALDEDTLLDLDAEGIICTRVVTIDTVFTFVRRPTAWTNYSFRFF